MFKSKSNPSRPAHHTNNSGTAFKNPWDSALPPTWTELLTKQSFPLEFYKDGLHGHAKARKVDVVAPDWGISHLQRRGLKREKCIIGTWLGHAGAIVELPLAKSGKPTAGSEKDEKKKNSLWFVFDPIFSNRAGPTQYTGPARFNKAPCQVNDLPGCDAVFISHNHYDHLDTSTIQGILKVFPKTKFFVALNNKNWLHSMGVDKANIHELDWWDKKDFSPLDFGYDVENVNDDEVVLRMTCVPAQHNSGRGALDKDSTLWCGWVIEQLISSRDEATESTTRRHGSIYHAGDTGYRRLASSKVVCPAFAEIAEKFGGFDLSFIPIWRGGTLGFISSVGLRLSHKDMPAMNHASPDDAVAIHLDVKSRHTIGVHFGTFVGSDKEALEATIEFGEACDERKVGDLPGRAEEKGVEDVQASDDGERGFAGTIDIGASYAVEI